MTSIVILRIRGRQSEIPFVVSVFRYRSVFGRFSSRRFKNCLSSYMKRLAVALSLKGDVDHFQTSVRERLERLAGQDDFQGGFSSFHGGLSSN